MGNAIIAHEKQPNAVHKAIERIAFHAKREGHWDSPLYGIHDALNENANAYFWIDEDWSEKFITGACVFRFLGDVGQNRKWQLEWVWIHPFYRGKGLLSGAWKSFEKKYGQNFNIELPLSHALIGFLKRKT
jgi:hypothetical protein